MNTVVGHLISEYFFSINFHDGRFISFAAWKLKIITLTDVINGSVIAGRPAGRLVGGWHGLARGAVGRKSETWPGRARCERREAGAHSVPSPGLPGRRRGRRSRSLVV